MKPICNKLKAKSLVMNLILCVFLFLLHACGSGGNGGGGGGTGSIAFTAGISNNLVARSGQIAIATCSSRNNSPIATVKLPPAKPQKTQLPLHLPKTLESVLSRELLRYAWLLAPSTAYADSTEGIDCEYNEIDKIEAYVYNEDGDIVATGGPWSCDQHSGIIEGIPMGNCKLVIYAKEQHSDRYIYMGEKGDPNDPITILPGKRTQVGKIMLYPMEPPKHPEGFAATDGEFTDRIRLTWRDVKHGEGYYIFRKDEGGNWELINETNVDITSYEDPQLCDLGFTYIVRAFNSAGESIDSKPDNGFTKVCPIEEPVPPENLIASEGEFTNQINLTWEWDGDGPLDGFQIYRSAESDAGPWGDPIRTDPEIRSYIDSDVDCTDGDEPIIYYYIVRAYNIAGESDDSNSDSGFTDVCPIYPPVAPYDLTASEGDFPKQIKLEWKWNGDGPLDGFRIYRSSESAPRWDDYFLEQIDDFESRSYSDYQVDCGGESWNYMVRAYNDAGESENSESISGFTAECPIFDFETDNQGWSFVGLYDDGGLEEIAGYFSNVPAEWLEASADESPRIGAGPGDRLEMPPSPSDDAFLHWDLVSPDLSGDNRWQDIIALIYDVKGGTLSSVNGGEDVYVQLVLHVLKPDGSESYFAEENFHNIPLGKPEELNWATYTVDIAAFDMPEGTIILNINLRVFFLAGAEYDGEIWVDNIIGRFDL